MEHTNSIYTRKEYSQGSQIKEKTPEERLREIGEEAKQLKKMIPKKARKKTLPQSMSDEEFSKLITYLNKRKANIRSKIAFLLAYESGMRISEVVDLKKEDIDTIAKTIFIREGKYSKDRVVPLPKHWKNGMLAYIPIGKSPRALQRIFKRAVKSAGLKETYHFHSLRHSFATHCLERGMPINQLQILLGHSSVATTNVYIQANPKDALASYEQYF
jgi:integrase